jgi:hypothetical protein
MFVYIRKHFNRKREHEMDGWKIYGLPTEWQNKIFYAHEPSE